MERNDLYGSLDFTSGTQDIENQLVGGRALYTYVLKELICPTDDHTRPSVTAVTASGPNEFTFDVTPAK